MKNVVIALCMVFFMMITVGSSNAALIPNGDVIYDDVNNKYWIADFGIFGDGPFSTTMSVINGFNQPNSPYQSSDWGDFRLATFNDVSEIYTYSNVEITSVFTCVTKILPPSGIDWYIWGGLYDDVFISSDGLSHAISTIQGYSNTPDLSRYGLPQVYSDDDNVGSRLGAWVVADATVPIPSAILLLFSGLVGIVGTRRFKKY